MSNLMSQTAIVAIVRDSWEWKVVKCYREKNNIREATADEYTRMSPGWREAYGNSNQKPLGADKDAWNNNRDNFYMKHYDIYLNKDDCIGHQMREHKAMLCKWPTHATREFIAENGHLATEDDKKQIEMVKAMAAPPVRVDEKKVSYLLMVSALRG